MRRVSVALRLVCCHLNWGNDLLRWWARTVEVPIQLLWSLPIAWDHGLTEGSLMSFPIRCCNFYPNLRPEVYCPQAKNSKIIIHCYMRTPEITRFWMWKTPSRNLRHLLLYDNPRNHIVPNTEKSCENPRVWPKIFFCLVGGSVEVACFQKCFLSENTTNWPQSIKSIRLK